MSKAVYIEQSINQSYSDDAFGFIENVQNTIVQTANALAVSAGAIAGGMVEENSSYSILKDYIQDSYFSIFNASHAQWESSYAAYQADGKPSGKGRLLYRVGHDLGPTNIKMATAIRLVKEYDATHSQENDDLELKKYANDYHSLGIALLDENGVESSKIWGLAIAEAKEVKRGQSEKGSEKIME